MGACRMWYLVVVIDLDKCYRTNAATSPGHVAPMEKRSSQPKAAPPINPKPTTTPNTNVMTISENIRANEVIIQVLDVGKIYTDQTGRFPVTFSRRHKYILVAFHPASNGIIAKPIKNRSTAELIRAQTKIHAYFTDIHFKLTYQILDNEYQDALKTMFKQKNVGFQLVPSHLHRNDLTERAIRIFKKHLLAGLASLEPTFSMHLWCQLIEHAQMTLNLLWSSQINPLIFAETVLN